MKHKVLIHASNNKFNPKDIINYSKLKPHNKFKPYGIWYALGTSWIKFMPDPKDKYFYFIKLYYTAWDNPDVNKVVKLDTIDAFDNFTFKYGYVDKDPLDGSYGQVFIDWNKVANDFGGIEVIPYHKTRTLVLSEKDRLKYLEGGLDMPTKIAFLWLDILDIPSGCVWNTKAIKKFALVPKILAKKLYKIIHDEINKSNAEFKKIQEVRKAKKILKEDDKRK